MLRENVSLEKFKKMRFYYWPISNNCGATCHYCDSIGAKNNSVRNSAERIISYKKMKSAPYDACILPCNFIFLENQEEILSELNALDIPIILQLNLVTLPDFSLESKILEWKTKISAINLIGDDSQHLYIEQINLIESAFFTYFTIVISKKTDVASILEKYGAGRRERVFFQFPHAHTAQKNNFYSCLEIFSFIQEIQRKYPHQQILPPPGIDTYDARIPADRNLEPIIQPNFVRNCTSSSVKISIIIPSYNNYCYLQNTLQHLFLQKWAPSNFEIIVVDDGSTDESEKKILAHFQIDKHNFKYIYFPRTQERKMGDGQFRAGIARNLGVKHSCGEILFFLDSDILLPDTYLEDLWEKHKQWDVIQARRIHLKQGVSSENTQYNDVVLGRDTYITDEGYWERFQNSTNDWMEVEDRWRFVCTYALSMHRKNFDAVNWIRKNYTFYGYEDTELGFALAQAGCSFHLNKTRVYHLDHRLDRSEFFKSHTKKKLLLRESAITFYHNTLDNRVYEHLSWLFRPHLKARVHAAPLKKYSDKMKFLISKNPFSPFQFSKEILKKPFPYPIRKIYYFSEYQLRKLWPHEK